VAVERGPGYARPLGDGTHRRRGRTDASMKLNCGVGDPRAGAIHRVGPSTQLIRPANFRNTVMFNH
jgi:hypothetical protein